MEEAAEAQEKVCDIHYKQMEKPDRDPLHALRAEEECRQLLVQFPNSQFAPGHAAEAAQHSGSAGRTRIPHGLLSTDNKGSYPAAANRLQAMVDQYPLYSQADEALWNLGDSYGKMGDRFEGPRRAGLYPHRQRLPVEREGRCRQREIGGNEPAGTAARPGGLRAHEVRAGEPREPGHDAPCLGHFQEEPDTTFAAKSGTPTMTGLRPFRAGQRASGCAPAGSRRRSGSQRGRFCFHSTGFDDARHQP